MTMLKDGYQTTVSFSDATSGASAVLGVMEEKEVTPPGIDGGDGIDISTMRNTTWKTKWNQSLKELMNASFTAAYDAGEISEVSDMINVNQQITVNFSDESSITFYGFLKSFTPNACTPGEQPTAECEIVPTVYTGSGEASGV